MTGCRLKDLTTESLREQAAQLSPALTHISEHVLAMLIVMRALGKDFWERELSSHANPSSAFFQERKSILTVHVADLIWRLRDKNGFSTLLRKNGDRSFESTYFELVASEMVDSSSESIDFVIPSGIKGQDYDLRAFGFIGYSQSAIEIKSRRKAFKSSRALRNFLNDARSQLPRGGIGILICKIPRSGHYASQQEVSDDIATWMRTSTRRIKRVILCWDVFERETLAVSFASWVIDPSGVSNEVFGAHSYQELGEISFLSDLGMEQRIEPGLRRRLFNRAGAGVKVTIGTWRSGIKNWWLHDGREASTKGPE